MPDVPIVITGSTGTITKLTEAAGGYRHFFYTGNYLISPYFAYPYFSINPTTATAHFDTANSIVETRDFCITPNGTHNDLEITLLPTFPPARPGFNAGYTVTYKNRGTTTLSGKSVQLNFDNNKMNFISASENVATQSTRQLVWNYNNLQPFESKTINVTFNLNMENHLKFKKGYYEAKVDFLTDEHLNIWSSTGKISTWFTSAIIFIVSTGDRYTIKNITYNSEDKNTLNFIKSKSENAYIHSGDFIDYNNFELEKSRLTIEMQNHGDNNFSNNYFEISGDSSLKKKKLIFL